MLLSATMIVKNEEENLERCLNSVKNFVDEIIIVDTGSTDKTMEIAKSFGAKIYEHPWENDFSKHRNQSISYATGDWLLMIDADEELCFDNGNTIDSIRNLLKEDIPENIKGLSIDLKDIQQNSIVMQFNSFRLFKKGHIKYDRIVHNKAIVQGDGTYLGGIYLNHYGYDLTPEKQLEKRKRSEPLLLKRIENNPDDFDAYFYIVQMYSVLNEAEKFIKYGEQYAQKSIELKQEMKVPIYFTMFRGYLRKEDKENANRWLQLGLKASKKENLDLALATAEYGAFTGDIQSIREGATSFLLLYDKLQKDPSLRSSFTFSFRLESLLYCIYLLTTINFEEAGFYYNNFKRVAGKLYDRKQTEEFIEYLECMFKKLGLYFTEKE